MSRVLDYFFQAVLYGIGISFGIVSIWLLGLVALMIYDMWRDDDW